MLWPTLHLRIARWRQGREGQKGTKAASEVTKATDQAVENATKSKAAFIPAHVMFATSFTHVRNQHTRGDYVKAHS
jgi:hypothetical protein